MPATEGHRTIRCTYCLKRGLARQKCSLRSASDFGEVLLQLSHDLVLGGANRARGEVQQAPAPARDEREAVELIMAYLPR